MFDSVFTSFYTLHPVYVADNSFKGFARQPMVLFNVLSLNKSYELQGFNVVK